MKKSLLALVLIPFLIGCSAQQTAVNFSNVLVGILNIAQAEETALPPQDSAIITPWVALGFTLDNQLNTCINAVPAAAKKAAFASCFTAFASGLLNPTELAQLRILTASSQSKVELWATAAIIGVNAALAAFGGVAQPMPVISTPPAVAQLNNLRLELRSEGYGL